MAQRLVDMSGDMPGGLRDLVERYGANASTSFALFMVRHIVGFVFMLFIGAIFSTLGGLLGSVLFVRKMPPGTIDVAR
jgi:hypothetical protein